VEGATDGAWGWLAEQFPSMHVPRTAEGLVICGCRG